MEPIRYVCAECEPDVILTTEIVDFRPCARHQTDYRGEEDAGVTTQGITMSVEADGHDCREFQKIITDKRKK